MLDQSELVDLVRIKTDSCAAMNESLATTRRRCRGSELWVKSFLRQSHLGITTHSQLRYRLLLLRACVILGIMFRTLSSSALVVPRRGPVNRMASGPRRIRSWRSIGIKERMHTPRRRVTSRLYSDMDELLETVLQDEFLLRSSASKSLTEGADGQEGDDSSGDWLRIDWNELTRNITTATSQNSENDPPPSPVDIIMVRDRIVYLKRDDQLRLPGSMISGNKARKMWSLYRLQFQQEFPRCVVSNGGPQSNAMLALAAVVHFHNEMVEASNSSSISKDDVTLDNRKSRFVYFTKKLPRFLRSQPNGNLFRAMSLGMELQEMSSEEYNHLFGGDSGGRVEPPPGLIPPIPQQQSLWIPQGGSCGMAVAGTRRLADEILSYWAEHGDNRPLSVCVPGGTCSTALLLHHGIRDMVTSVYADQSLDIQVIVVPCVGDGGYARRQMTSLNMQLGLRSDDIPSILPPSPPSQVYFGKQGSSNRDDYFRFGEPDPEILKTFLEMRDEHQVLLDLMYGSPAWTVMLRHWRSDRQKQFSDGLLSSPTLSRDREIMYVHSGGLEGINSQLLRYKYKDLVDLDDIQLPGKPKQGGKRAPP